MHKFVTKYCCHQLQEMVLPYFLSFQNPRHLGRSLEATLIQTVVMWGSSLTCSFLKGHSISHHCPSPLLNPWHLGRSLRQLLPTDCGDVRQQPDMLLSKGSQHVTSLPVTTVESTASGEKPRGNSSPPTDRGDVGQQPDMLLSKGSQHVTSLPITTVGYHMRTVTA
ncbi:uncharacterized protein LOC123505609 [Portunus trituberculatus]|uniref:uncharacterized protein LOC123505609 n=1 Tax=Portunus trituberculatus TaxID=210409 RepID=UPI001E1CCB50|nr:uncharacterized protein LOC123505609 [Portunus trituberculatus]